jgi:arginyl-tRNA synthetase
MDMPYAQEIADRMKKMMPPQLQEQEDGSSPEVQQVKQQASQVIQQLQQQLEAAHNAMQEAEQEAKQLEQKANDSTAQNALEAKRVEIEEYKAETDRLKVELDAAQKADLTPERLQMIEDAVAKIIDHIAPEENELGMQQPQEIEQPQQPQVGEIQ